MPTPMIYSNQHVFEEISLTAFGAQALKLGATTIGRLISGLQGRSASQALNNSNINILGPAGNLIRKGMALAGTPINPKLEVLYSHTPQRSFVMEMLFAPKNQKESDTMKKIIDTLRYHAAPEIDGLGGGQFFEGGGPIPVFIPPSEFDITFYYRGQENTRIPRINTCVLERIEVDYAPSGVYSTFSNGHPVAARLSLSFRELEILHKKRVTQGF
jgi:hypothetical protein